MTITETPLAITGVVLAGGRATRMGGNDKGLVQLAGKTLAEHIIERLVPQVGPIIINANRNESRYADFGYPVIADILEGYWGPLAGMASAMQTAATPYIVSVPCDSPFVPNDLVERLYTALQSQSTLMSVAESEGRLQPVFALLNRRLLPDLLDYLNNGGRKVEHWFESHPLAKVDFSDCPEAFININTPEDIITAEAGLLKTNL